MTHQEITNRIDHRPVVEQLRQAIEAYEGPLPAIGDSIEEVWFRGAVKQLLALEQH